MDVIALAVLCTTLTGSPQDVGQPVRRTTVPTTQDPKQSEARRRASDFEGPGSSELPKGDTAPTQRLDRNSPVDPRTPDLAAVYQAVGLPSDLRDLGGVMARVQLLLFDGGKVLADVEVLHFADLGGPGQRDRLEFKGIPGVGRVYGRDSESVFAEMYGMVWQPLEKDAADELEVFGALLRFPWVFSDERFLVSSPERVTVRRQSKTRFRVQRRQTDPESESVDRFDVICDPLTLVPEAVHMIRTNTSARVEVQFSDYAAYEGVSVPLRRTFLGADGEKVMEIRITSLDVHQELPLSLFRSGR